MRTNRPRLILRGAHAGFGAPDLVVLATAASALHRDRPVPLGYGAFAPCSEAQQPQPGVCPFGSGSMPCYACTACVPSSHDLAKSGQAAMRGPAKRGESGAGPLNLS